MQSPLELSERNVNSWAGNGTADAECSKSFTDANSSTVSDTSDVGRRRNLRSKIFAAEMLYVAKAHCIYGFFCLYLVGAACTQQKIYRESLEKGVCKIAITRNAVIAQNAA